MTLEGLNDLDLSFTPPFGSPWDAIQLAAQDWVRAAIAGRVGARKSAVGSELRLR